MSLRYGADFRRSRLVRSGHQLIFYESEQIESDQNQIPIAFQLIIIKYGITVNSHSRVGFGHALNLYSEDKSPFSNINNYKKILW